METEIAEIRKYTIEKTLAKQDEQFRRGFDEKPARERPGGENLTQKGDDEHS